MSGKSILSFLKGTKAGYVGLYLFVAGASLVLDTILIYIINRILHAAGVPMLSLVHLGLIALLVMAVEYRFRALIRTEVKKETDNIKTHVYAESYSLLHKAHSLLLTVENKVKAEVNDVKTGVVSKVEGTFTKAAEAAKKSL